MSARLPARLWLSHAVVLAVGGLVSWLTVRVIAPSLFDRRMGAANGAGPMGGRHDEIQAAFIGALDTALLVGAGVAALVAGVVAAFVTRRLLRPLDAVRATTRQVAAGRYDARVSPLPTVPELAALASDVNSLAAALADTERRRVQLIGEVAHEMRTPLTALQGWSEGLVDGIFTADGDTLAGIQADVRRLSRLADDLSLLSRAEEGRLAIAPEHVDLTRVVREAVARAGQRAAASGVEVAVRDAGVVPVSADADRISQVVGNLLDNAIRATPGGAVLVDVRPPSAGTGEACVTVTDDGVGLSAEELPHVFERFYRAGGTRGTEGSGIGLTIARSIAVAHGGRLTASSPGPGRGATFTLALPTLPTLQALAAPQDPASPEPTA